MEAIEIFAIILCVWIIFSSLLFFLFRRKYKRDFVKLQEKNESQLRRIASLRTWIENKEKPIPLTQSSEIEELYQTNLSKLQKQQETVTFSGI
jgi:hypothetical protein